MRFHGTVQYILVVFFLLVGISAITVTPAKSRPLEFVDCPTDTIRGSACDVFHVQVRAIDHGWPGMAEGSRYILIDGPGYVDPRTGEWSYVPSGQDLGKTFEVEIAASGGEIMTNGAQNCRFQVAVAPNYPPVIYLDTYNCCSSFSLYTPGRTFVPLYTYDPDSCDQVSTSIESIIPEPVGHVSLGSSWGLTFVADSLDADKTFLVTVGATDGIDTTYCDLTFEVHSLEPYEVRIEKTHDTYQGHYESVDVTLESAFGPSGGFDLLLTYDRSALNLQMVTEGDLYNQCDWEYFTYRNWFWPTFEPHGFWAGLVRVISIAELNNGTQHPTCFILPTPFVLFTLDFLVTDNRQFECLFTPIQFYWTDCGDNTIASRFGDTLFMSRFVYDPEGVDITQDDTFPTYFGAPSECLDDPNPRFPHVRLVDFYNGGIQIECGDTIDVTGDVNLNGMPYEIADMVVFTNYFIYGLAAFHVNTSAQIAATDMNRDGVTLDVADLIYGIRVIIGDALPPDSLDTTSPFTARFIQDFDAGTIEVVTTDTLAAAYMLFEGNVMFSLLQPHMDQKYAYDAEEGVTRLLLYSFDGSSFSSGPVVSLSGEGVLIEVSAATYQGVRVETRIDRRGSPGYPSEYLPASFTLYQNYPNPFNNTTSIRFDLSRDDHIEFQVINMLGQVVYSFHRRYQAGWHQIEWNGADNSGSPLSSGVYFYHLKTSDFPNRPNRSDSKKMILLK